MIKFFNIIMIAIIIIVGGCDGKTNSMSSSTSNNDIGKIASVNNILYYINDGVLYKVESDNMTSVIDLHNIYALQTVNDIVYAFSYNNGKNTIYDVTGNNTIIYEFDTNDIPNKVLMDNRNYYYQVNSKLYVESINEKGRSKCIENVYDFATTDEGVFFLTFTGDIGNQQDNFVDIYDLSLKSEIKFVNWDNKTKVVAEVDGYGDFLSNYGDKVVYRCGDGIFIAAEHSNECVVENVIPSSIVTSNNKIYFSDLQSGCIKEYSEIDKTTTEIAKYSDLIGIVNNELIKSDLSKVKIAIGIVDENKTINDFPDLTSHCQ